MPFGDYLSEMQEQECTDVPPAPSSLSPVLETDHATHPEPPRLTYAAAVRHLRGRQLGAECRVRRAPVVHLVLHFRGEAINRLLKPAAPPDSGNGVVVPHEAPDGPPKPKKKGKK